MRLPLHQGVSTLPGSASGLLGPPCEFSLFHKRQRVFFAAASLPPPASCQVNREDPKAPFHFLLPVPLSPNSRLSNPILSKAFRVSRETSWGTIPYPRATSTGLLKTSPLGLGGLQRDSSGAPRSYRSAVSRRTPTASSQTRPSRPPRADVCSKATSERQPRVPLGRRRVRRPRGAALVHASPVTGFPLHPCLPASVAGRRGALGTASKSCPDQPVRHLPPPR